MAHNVNLLERAFQLARDGDCRTIAEITKVLKTEDYNGVDAQLQGPSLRGQLRQLCMVARRTPGDSSDA